MRRYLYLLSPVLLFMLVMVSMAVAQTLTADNPPPPGQALWEIAIKAIFPVLITAVAPHVTGWITSSFAKVHPSIQYVISSVLGLVMGAITSQIPGVPLSTESAANIGAGAGATGQYLANRSRAEMHPKTEAAKVEMAAMEKQQPGSSNA